MCLPMRSSFSWIQLYCVNSSLAVSAWLKAEKDLCTPKWYHLKRGAQRRREGGEGDGGGEQSLQ